MNESKIPIIVISFLLLNFLNINQIVSQNEADYVLITNFYMKIQENRDAYCKFEFNYFPTEVDILYLTVDYQFILLDIIDPNSIHFYFAYEKDPQKIPIDHDIIENQIKVAGEFTSYKRNPFKIIYEFVIPEAFTSLEESPLEIWEELIPLNLTFNEDFSFHARIEFPYGYDYDEKGYMALVGVRVPLTVQVEKTNENPVIIDLHAASITGELYCPMFFYFSANSKPKIVLNFTDRIYLEDFKEVRLNKDLSVSNLTEERIQFCTKKDENKLPILYIFGKDEEGCESPYIIEAGDTEPIEEKVIDYPVSEEKITPVHKESVKKEIIFRYPFDQYKINLKQEFSSQFEKGTIGTNYGVDYSLSVNEPKNLVIWGDEGNYVKVWSKEGRITIPLIVSHLSEYRESYHDAIYLKKNYFSLEITKNKVIPLEFVLDSAHSKYIMEISVIVGRNPTWLLISLLLTAFSWVLVILRISKYRDIFSSNKVLSKINMDIWAIVGIHFGFYVAKIYYINYIWWDKFLWAMFCALIVSFYLNYRNK